VKNPGHPFTQSVATLLGVGLTLAGCSTGLQTTAGRASCAQLTPPKWVSASVDWRPHDPLREVRVALVSDRDTRDGWRAHGTHRLHTALAHWNNVSLPVKLVPAKTLRSAEITVYVIRSFPPETPNQRYRAGQTNLTYVDGEITSAQIFIAEATPLGERYSVADQLATLLHELGHAIGLPHVAHPDALMATRTRAGEVTAVDVTLARSVYSARGCPRVQLAANETFPQSH